MAVFVALRSGEVSVVAIPSGAHLKQLEDFHTGEVTDVAVSSVGDAWTCAKDGYIAQWDLQNAKVLQYFIILS